MPENGQQAIFNEPVTRHITRDFAVVRQSQTVGDTISQFSANPPAGQFFYIYVLDDQERLVGVLPIRALLLNPSSATIQSLIEPRVVAIPAAATVLEACEFFVQYRYLAMPVTDEAGRILGVVDVGLFTDEVMDLAEQRSRDNIFQLIGINVRHNQKLDPWAGFRDRFPWLVANIIGGTICALLSSHFEGLLANVVAVAMFVPIVLTLSESVSIQSMTIVLEGLHGTRMEWSMFGRAIVREFSVAILLGVASGAIVGLVGWLWRGDAALGLAIAMSMTMTLTLASLLGLMMPVVIRWLRADPRIAAGPIVLATTDVVTLLVYFSIATRILMA